MLKKIPDTFIIIFFLIIIAAALTWFIPGGQYNKDNKSDKEETELHYKPVKSLAQTWQVFTAFQKGFQKQASIIIFVLIVGGAFWIINDTRSIDYAILALVKRMKKWENKGRISIHTSSLLILVLVMLIFSVFGAVFGMSEETIAFIAIMIPLSISMGFDSLTGVAIVFVAAGLGFAGAILNPFTIGIAQGIAELPLFSGIEYRLFCWVIINVIGISYILWYASRIRNNPKKSTVYNLDKHWRKRTKDGNEIKSTVSISTWVMVITISLVQIIFALKYPINNISIGNSSISLPALPIAAFLYTVTSLQLLYKRKLHLININLIAFTILYLLIGVLGYGWYIDEISALFLALGISVALCSGKSGKELAKLFQEGAKDILGAALIIGLAGGIIVVLEEGQIIDSILYHASSLMKGNGKTANIGIMYLIQNALNILIPSGSAKAAITMPIMAPFSDLIGISRQATVMAFQFGDGFTNLITPTSGVMMAVIGVAKIPFTIWFRWVSPLIIILIVVGFLLLIPTVTISLNGF